MLAVSVLHPRTGREVMVSTKGKTASKRAEVEQVNITVTSAADEVEILDVMRRHHELRCTYQ